MNQQKFIVGSPVVFKSDGLSGKVKRVFLRTGAADLNGNLYLVWLDCPDAFGKVRTAWGHELRPVVAELP